VLDGAARTYLLGDGNQTDDSRVAFSWPCESGGPGLQPPDPPRWMPASAGMAVVRRRCRMLGSPPVAVCVVVVTRPYTLGITKSLQRCEESRTLQQSRAAKRQLDRGTAGALDSVEYEMLADLSAALGPNQPQALIEVKLVAKIEPIFHRKILVIAWYKRTIYLRISKPIAAVRKCKIGMCIRLKSRENAMKSRNNFHR
jgi:hypothetical protein